MTATKGERRLTSIDLMKCIAIFLVLSYHSTYYSYNILDGSVAHYFAYFFRTIISPCVPLFFFINGFLLFKKEFELKKHIKKIIHLLILTELWNCITLLIMLLIEQETISFKDFVWYLYVGRDGWTNHLWYMGALICVYIFFPLLKVAYDHNKKTFIYFFIVCMLMTLGNVLVNEIGTIANGVLRGGTRWLSINWFKTYNPFRAIYGYSFAYFCAGGIINMALPKLEKIPVIKRNFLAICGITVSCLLLWGTGIINTHIAQNVWDIVWYGYDTIFTFANVIFIFVLCLNWKKDIFIIRSISQNTLGIYFIHGIFRVMFLGFVSERDWIGCMPINLIYSLFLLLLSYLVCIIIRKIPLIKNLVK